MTVKYYCDRCGKEIKFKDSMEEIMHISDWKVENTFENEINIPLLCKNCKKELNELIKKFVKKEI